MEKICETTIRFVRFSPASIADIDLIIEYAREGVAGIAGADGVKDPVLIEYFDERVVGDQLIDLVQARLDVLLESLESAAQRGDADAASQLTDLCRTGVRSHRLLLSLSSAAEQILRTAYRLGLVDALRDAASPANAHDGQVASRQHHRAAFELALNLLAHLASDPERGAGARSALLDLAGFVETAGEAVIRLPMHLLDDGERQRLLTIHEARVALFTSDPVRIPLGLELLRDNRVVRSAVWQAFDARHIG
ncbi:hypothetical protein [Rhabdothermincola salaria]|uniref:hypothetical protein n=1 Tax=Rhabdothermincola salaria TaxID=2903142 RepID=UPI001E32DF80|nr:hypothetical protein [Rhabdothermincola salaria]MCD9625264.1 hypothetical protein [Rhabdothermincola salaria]